MAKLSWNPQGGRVFETGVDRGVLYPKGKAGVAWNGLVGLSENPTGGNVVPYYMDGRRYRTETRLEEYQATLEAFTYPDEFALCDGTAFLSEALYVFQQERQMFDLSYRTRVGNDTSSTDHGYRIHLVYNAMAEPTQKSYSTQGDNPEAMTMSWALSAIPITIPGLRPSSHLVVDSTKTDAETMALVEEQLYGGILGNPRVPTPQELVAILESTTARLRISPNEGTGLSGLFPSEEADISGKTYRGLYKATPDSRLIATAIPGLYTLEQ